MNRQIEGRLNAEGKRFAIVASLWNEHITKQLVEGALRAFRMCGNDDVQVVWVPGTWEIPVAALKLAQSGIEGIVSIGCILQGATIHASQLSNQVCAAVSEVSIKTRVPITWGILTCDTQEEAIERAGMKLGNKGEEAALALVETVSALERATA